MDSKRVLRASILTLLVTACTGLARGGNQPPGQVGLPVAPADPRPAPDSGSAAEAESVQEGGRLFLASSLLSPIAPSSSSSKAKPPRGPESGELLVFTAIDPTTKEAVLAVWDEAARDAYALPVIGKDVGTGAIYMQTKILFDRPAGGIFALDLLTETISWVPGINEVGWTNRPSAAKDGLSMVFIANPDGLGGIRPGVTRAYYWRNGVAADLASVNSVGDSRGGAVARVRMAGNGKVLTFVTLDGGLFLYTLGSGALYEVSQAREVGDGYSHHPILNGDATELAWATGRTIPQSIFFLDLATIPAPGGEMYVAVGKPRPLPEADVLLGSGVVTAPKFGPKGTVYFEGRLPGPDPVFKAFRFDRSTGTVRMLSVLNSTVPEDSAIYAGTGLP